MTTDVIVIRAPLATVCADQTMPLTLASDSSVWLLWLASFSDCFQHSSPLIAAAVAIEQDLWIINSTLLLKSFPNEIETSANGAYFDTRSGLLVQLETGRGVEGKHPDSQGYLIVWAN